MGLWPLSWQWWCHAIFCANTQEWYGWQICLLRELKKWFSWQFFPKIQICLLPGLNMSTMCKSSPIKKIDLVFWAQILIFQKISCSHIWRIQKAIRICKKTSLKNLANIPFAKKTVALVCKTDYGSILSLCYHQMCRWQKCGTFQRGWSIGRRG